MNEYCFTCFDDPRGQNFLTLEFSISHSDTPHSVGLFWTSDLPVKDKRLSKETDNHAPRGFAPAIPASERTQTHALDRWSQGRAYRHAYVWLRTCSCYFIAIHYVQCNDTGLSGPINYVTVTVFPTLFCIALQTCQPFDDIIHFCGNGQRVRQEGWSCSMHADWSVCFYAISQKCSTSAVLWELKSLHDICL